MNNYNKTKTLNLSKEQKKRFNKIINEGGGSNSSISEYDVYLEVEEEIASKLKAWNSDIFINSENGLRERADGFLLPKNMLDGLPQLNNGDIICIYINDERFLKLLFNGITNRYLKKFNMVDEDIPENMLDMCSIGIFSKYPFDTEYLRLYRYLYYFADSIERFLLLYNTSIPMIFFDYFYQVKLDAISENDINKHLYEAIKNKYSDSFYIVPNGYIHNSFGNTTNRANNIMREQVSFYYNPTFLNLNDCVNYSWDGDLLMLNYHNVLYSMTSDGIVTVVQNNN